jgi:hypothetical protein
MFFELKSRHYYWSSNESFHHVKQAAGMMKAASESNWKLEERDNEFVTD